VKAGLQLTETDENMNVDVTYSKFTRVSFVVISMLLIFVGPTYVPYAMGQLNVDGFVSAGVGALLFVVGLVFLMFLVKKKVIQA
jgi:hypothetical protein